MLALVSHRHFSFSTSPFVFPRHPSFSYDILRFSSSPFVLPRHLSLTTSPFIFPRHPSFSYDILCFPSSPFVSHRYLSFSTSPFVSLRHLLCHHFTFRFTSLSFVFYVNFRFPTASFVSLRHLSFRGWGERGLGAILNKNTNICMAFIIHGEIRYTFGVITYNFYLLTVLVVYKPPLPNNLKFRGAEMLGLLWNAYKIL